MASLDTSDPTTAGRDDFWDRMRLAAHVPCLISGVFCADRKGLQDFTISADAGHGPKAAPEMIRHLCARMSAFTAIRARFAPDKGATRSDTAAPSFPIWLLMNKVVIGVGQPMGTLYPVVAFDDQPQAHGTGLQDLLALGLAHIEHQLMRHASSRSTWPEGLAESTLRLLSIGLFVVDARGHIVHDQSGDGPAGDNVWVPSRSRLTVRSEAEQAALQAAISDATCAKRLGSIISVTSEGGAMQMVAVAPLQLGDTAMALVLFEPRQTDHRALREHFFKVHALTKSEGLIAREVLDGRAPAEIAEMTGMSVGTVRGYLKQVFAKTGTHRQSELVSHYYGSILPIGASIARADLRAAPARPRKPNLTLVPDNPPN